MICITNLLYKSFSDAADYIHQLKLSIFKIATFYNKLVNVLTLKL